jgi:hypothetical protein
MPRFESVPYLRTRRARPSEKTTPQRYFGPFPARPLTRARPPRRGGLRTPGRSAQASPRHIPIGAARWQMGLCEVLVLLGHGLRRRPHKSHPCLVPMAYLVSLSEAIFGRGRHLASTGQKKARPKRPKMSSRRQVDSGDRGSGTCPSGACLPRKKCWKSLDGPIMGTSWFERLAHG